MLYGFEHDVLASDESKKAKLTIGMKELMPFAYTHSTAKMNLTNTNSGSWNGSYMKTVLNDIYNKMPFDLRAVIADVIKTTSDGSGFYTVTDSHEKLFLFSNNETTTSNATVSPYNKEEQQHNVGLYPVFYDVTSRIKAFCENDGTFTNTSDWWLRSPAGGTSNGFVSVAANGGIIYSGNGSMASKIGGVVFGFCVGEEK